MDNRIDLVTSIHSTFVVLSLMLVLGVAGCAGTANQMSTPAATDAPDAGYLLGPEDVLTVTVWRDEHLTKETVVRPDGMISFPLIEDVPAAGRTVADVRADITKRLTRYMPTPNVSVAVTKLLSYRIYVLGRVNKPGEFMVGHTTDILQALSLAGGLTPYASENDIKIIRRVGGEQQTFEFRYAEVRKGKDLNQNIILQRGDVVMVP
ncbi:putative polysaccharide export protein [Nitrospira sp. KM1]|uniref:polysaccharide biosynthesis/export family protein n=1 Tax=Nitrospira sp. KM1 TaxID=1936990 RepID=UPI0013A7AF26|nr:polysaccharide biosynthesis/export family protein [Nitrospira sp. KM1]BCA57134.1 putative polysaccharide export protein [Nitrospira sp. KM1]